MLSHELVSEEIVATDKFLSAISAHVTHRWEGTGKDLYALLPRPIDDRFWPEQRGVSGKLKKVAPDLRKAGWVIEQVVPDPKSRGAARPAGDRKVASPGLPARQGPPSTSTRPTNAGAAAHVLVSWQDWGRPPTGHGSPLRHES